MSACPGNVCGLDKTEIVLTGPSTSVQGYHAWSIIYDVRTLNMSPRRTKATILQCMYDQQRLRSVCASTHYIKQASWIALNPQTVHTVWSSKGLILGGGGPIYGIVRMCVPNSPLFICRPRWLSWMRRPTGDQEVAGSTPAEVGNILSWRLIMKYFLRSFSPFRWFKKGSCQFPAKECAQYWLTA